MARLARAWPCLVSALLLNLAYAPISLSLLILVGLVPWLNSLRNAGGKSGFRSGWTFGFLFLLGQFLWIFTFVNRWVQNPLLALIPYAAACAAGALYFGLAGWQVTLCWRQRMPWGIPLVWAGVEVFRSYIPVLAFPYGLIATPLWNFPWMIQTAYFGSIFLVGAWAVLVNVLFCELLGPGSKWKQVRGYVAVSVVLLLASWVKYSEPLSDRKIAVTIGQPGVDMAFGDHATQDQRIAEAVQRFSAQATINKSAFLLLPEGISGDGGEFPPQTHFVLPETVPVVFGGQRSKGTDRFQTAFAYDGAWSYADKTRLVIFGEYVPFRRQIPFLADAFRLPGGDLVPGDKVATLKAGEWTLGPVLCFEGLFPDIAFRQALNGAQILTVMSVDDWYMGSGAPDQLRAASVWRAVETGLPLVRSASTGYSMAVNPSGDVIAEIPLRESRSIRVELATAKSGPFPYLPIFPLASLASLIILPIAVAVGEKRNGPRK